MNINSLVHLLRDSISDDSAIKTFTNLYYSQDHEVFIGLDARNPPTDSQYPLVSIYPGGKTIGYDLMEENHTINISCGVHDSGVIATGKTNATELAGPHRVEELRQLVVSAIVNTDLGGIYGTAATSGWLSSVKTEYDTVEFFPFALCNMELDINLPYYSGDSVPL